MNTIEKRNGKAAAIMAIGTVVNALLFGVKLWIGLAANNISILTDAINNLGDVLTCVLSFICFLLLRSQNRSERFPHGLSRLETVSSFVMSLIVVFIGGYFFITALNRMMLASLVVFKWAYFGILLGSVFIKIALAVFYRYQNKKITSDVLRCASIDSVIDASITFMTVVGLLLSKYVQLRLDGIFGIIVSAIMIVEGVRLFLSDLRALLGVDMDKKDKEIITSILRKADENVSIEKLDYHDYGVNEKVLYIFATFTNGVTDDIINTISEQAFQETNIKIYFVKEVLHEEKN